MTSSRSCASSFDPSVRGRGNTYFERGRVTIHQSDTTGLEASVRGSGEMIYDVSLTWLGQGDIGALCDCPYFESGDLCKHVWATILMAELDGWMAGSPNAKETAVVWSTSEWDDAGLDELAGGSDTATILPMGRPHRTGASSWKHSLKQIITDAAYERIPTAVPKPERQAWYILNVQASLGEQRLVIEYYQRQRLGSGEFGKIKRQGIAHEDVRSFDDPTDRHLLALLLGNDPALDYRRDLFGAGVNFRRNACYLTPLLYDAVLPQLCATGRFIAQRGGHMVVEEGNTVTWDDGDPWRYRLDFKTNEAEQLWELSATLVRGDDAVALREPVFLLPHGLVLCDGELGRLDLAPGENAWMAALQRQSVIRIPFADRDELIELWWSAPKQPAAELPAPLRLERIRAHPRGKFQVLESRLAYGSSLYARVTFDYDGMLCRPDIATSGIVDGERQRVIVRDREAEALLLARIATLGVRESTGYNYDRGEYTFARPRLVTIVTELLKGGWVVETETHPIRSPGAPSLRVSSGADWFDLEGGVDFGDTSASLPALLEAVSKGHWQVSLEDGSSGLIPQEWLQKFETLARLGEVAAERVRFKPSQAMLLDALLSAENATVDHGFERWREKLRSFAGVQPQRQPDTFEGHLRPYQEEGLGWLHFLREFRLGGCLADDMGLGKTVQALALLERCRTQPRAPGEQRLPSLVVVPKSLVFNWLIEARQFAPQLRVLNYTGAGRTKLKSNIPESDLVLTTYGTLRRDAVALKAQQFEYAILDEAQAIKNAQAQTAKAARLIDARHRLVMTGTPVENHLGELWSLFEFLNPGVLGDSTAFNALVKRRQLDDNESRNLLAAGLRPFILRRTKEQVLPDLPKKSEQTLYCELSGKQRKAYDELRDYYRTLLGRKLEDVGLARAKIHVLEALLRLRQTACHPGLVNSRYANENCAKFETLTEHLDEVISGGHKALIFSQFTALLALLRRQLDRRAITYEYLDGRTSKREEPVFRFQNDPDCPLFLVSLKAGGHGLNLTAADYVFILDPWWNPAVEAQAVDRAHRIGQTRPVFAYRLIARDTVEEKILELQGHKKKLADAILSEDNSVMRNLTAEDLQLLLS